MNPSLSYLPDYNTIIKKMYRLLSSLLYTELLYFISSMDNMLYSCLVKTIQELTPISNISLNLITIYPKKRKLISKIQIHKPLFIAFYNFIIL